MKIVVACSKNWFKLDESISSQNEIIEISGKQELTEDMLTAFNPDIVFFPHWNWVVKPEIFEKFECIVFHTAPLPYGRGGSPIQNLILENFNKSPVCALKMTSELDAGPIYAQEVISLEGDLFQIFERISIAVNNLVAFIITNQPRPTNQDGRIHNFKRRTKDENRIASDLPIGQIYDRIRMLDGEGYPNAFVTIGDLKIDFFSARIEEDGVVAKCRITKC